MKLRPRVVAVANSFDSFISTTKKNTKDVAMKSNSAAFNSQEISFSNLIPKRLIEYLSSDCERCRIFDPSSTLFCFLYQVINSCSGKAALLNLNISRLKNGLRPISMNTSALTKAKKRLCEVKLKNIATELGKGIDKESKLWNFKGRDVFLGDGTVINLEDTKDIKKGFPVNRRKMAIQGLPKMRLFCLFNSSSGSFINGKIGSYCGKGQAETSLLRSLLKEIKKDAILVLDRFFTNPLLRKMIVEIKLNYVIRARDEAAKKILKRKKEKVFEDGSGHKVRYIKSSYNRDGFRPAVTFIMTNLLDSDGLSKEDIELLYLKRWGVELDIRHLKQTLHASFLRSMSSEMVKKEIWVHLIAFNLIRKLSNSNCSKNHHEPRKQSFKIYLEVMIKILNGAIKNGEEFFLKILEGEILNSPYRREPRAIRRFLKRFEVMNMTRKQAKNKKWGKSGRKHRAGLLAREAA